MKGRRERGVKIGTPMCGQMYGWMSRKRRERKERVKQGGRSVVAFLCGQTDELMGIMNWQAGRQMEGHMDR